MKRSLLTVSLSLISYISVSQITPDQLQVKDVQNDIIQHTNEFDSLVLIDVSSYWHDKMQINGYGYMQGEAYMVTVVFKEDEKYMESVNKVLKKKKTNKLKIDSIKNLKCQRVLSFSEDSLKVRSRDGTYMDVSDADHWTIMGVYPSMQKFKIKQVYSLENYQFTKEEIIMKRTIEGLLTLLGTD